MPIATKFSSDFRLLEHNTLLDLLGYLNITPSSPQTKCYHDMVLNGNATNQTPSRCRWRVTFCHLNSHCEAWAFHLRPYWRHSASSRNSRSNPPRKSVYLVNLIAWYTLALKMWPDTAALNTSPNRMGPLTLLQSLVLYSTEVH
jgi:hypothetical protein